MKNLTLASPISRNEIAAAMPHIAKPWTALLLIAAIVVPVGINLFPYWWGNPLYGCGLLVPVLAIMLFCRQEKAATEPGLGFFGVIAVSVIGFYFCALPIIRVVQVANPDWRLIDLFFSGAAIATLLAFAYYTGGPALFRRAFLPACFLIVALPWPTSMERVITQSAVPLTADVAAELAWLFDVSTANSGRTLYTVVGPVSVTEACSGIRSLYLAFVASVFWAGWFALGFTRGAVLFVSGLVLALVINVFRVVALVLIAVWSRDLASVDAWHDIAAQCAQLLLMVGVPLIAWLLERTIETTGGIENSALMQTSSEDAPAFSRPSQRQLPWYLAMGALVWIGVSEWCVEAWFRSRERLLPHNSAYWAVRDPSVVSGESKPIPEIVRESYRLSDARYFTWNGAKNGLWSLNWLYIDRGAISNYAHNIHRPEVCLLSGDYHLDQRLPDLEVNVRGEKLIFQHKRFRRGGQILHLFHTAKQENGAINQDVAPEWSWQGRLQAAWQGVRSQQVSLVHLQAEYPYSDAEARAAALEYLGKLLERRSAKNPT